MASANINPEMLSWARQRLGLSVGVFAKKLGKSEDCVVGWEAGEKPITFVQAMNFAKKAYVPLGYLFLSKAPEEQLPLPDLRTLDGSLVHRPSAELLDLIKLMIQRQEWYKAYLKEEAVEPNSLVGSFANTLQVTPIVDDMRVKLNVPKLRDRGDWEDYYRELVAKIESIGILVMRQGDLGHFSRRLDVAEFRGFAIVDDYAPLIFVNQSDSPGARLFTLIHELCHIWIGQSGISDGDTASARQDEQLCNAVAAEFLVPETEFVKHWQTDIDNWKSNLPLLELKFHVSKWVLARRALTVGYISQTDYQEFVTAEQDAFKRRETSRNGGPTYYRTRKAQISERFSRAVVSQALNGTLLLRDAGQLLDMKPSNVSKFARELQL